MSPVEEILKINTRQRLLLYETSSRFFLVGCNAEGSHYRVLKIDRTEAHDKLSLFLDNHVYTHEEYSDLFRRIYLGNQGKVTGRRKANEDLNSSGLSQTLSAFGLIGFVRFTEGYYMILVTKRRKVAQFAQHIIYKVEDTAMVYIPRTLPEKWKNMEEARYMKMFQSVDLSSNFYFSYTYDTTNTVQYNLHPTAPPNLSGGSEVWCVEQKARDRFLWNAFLMEPVTDPKIQREWILPLIHGFIDQTQFLVFGQAYRVTLIARRSRFFAGTRFLKRGCNRFGDVANEVETEQIVHEAATLPFHKCPVTSFVQMRGSIPVFWGQDLQKVVKKPDIMMMKEDPFCEASGAHFSDLLTRYGSPIIMLSLVKRKEHCQESRLTKQIQEAFDYLNQFVPRDHRLRYRAFDVARCQKAKNSSVLRQLTRKAKRYLQKTGIFHLGHSEQQGIIRTNCVDCLDRTNTGQFVIGRVACGLQLHALGAMASPHVEDRSQLDCLLEDLYEDHGDTLAVQYGGSQLVHTINTYRKTAPLTSQTRDILQTMSRYYSNAFSDAEKQAAINLFLGIFRPKAGRAHIWELPTDMYVHFHHNLDLSPPWRPAYTAWISEEVLAALPRPYSLVCKRDIVRGELRNRRDEEVDWREEYLRPYEMTSFNDLTACFMPTINFEGTNPSTVGRRQSELAAETERQTRWEADRASSSEGSSLASRSGSDDTLSTSWEGVTMDGSCCAASNRLVRSTDRLRALGVLPPNQSDLLIYQKFTAPVSSAHPQTVCSVFRMESSRGVSPPVISIYSREVYAQAAATAKGKLSADLPKPLDIGTYRFFVSSAV